MSKKSVKRVMPTKTKTHTKAKASTGLKTTVSAADDKAFNKHPGGRPVKYPWDQWMAKKSFKLEQGEHFTCQVSTMLVQLHNNAKSRNIKICTRCVGTTINVKRVVA